MPTLMVGTTPSSAGGSRKIATHAQTIMQAKQTSPVRSAYTLIELVTVISILAVLAAFVGGPTMGYIGEMRASGAGARLASDIRYMQRMASASGRRTWVVFDASNDRYSLHVEDAANPGKAGRLSVAHPLDQSTDPVQFGSGAFAASANAVINVGNATPKMTMAATISMIVALRRSRALRVCRLHRGIQSTPLRSCYCEPCE